MIVESSGVNYDTNAWKKINGSKIEPEPMKESEARRFKHSSLLGSHLLYPYVREEIEYLDTVPTGVTYMPPDPRDTR